MHSFACDLVFVLLHFVMTERASSDREGLGLDTILWVTHTFVDTARDVNINQSINATQRIRSHDEVCTHSLEHFAKPPVDNEGGNKGSSSTVVDQEEQEAIKHTLSYDTAETAEQSMELEWKECPICMEEFKADEIVSWSPDDQTSCLHFFHHECIKGRFLLLFFRENSRQAINVLFVSSRV